MSIQDAIMCSVSQLLMNRFERWNLPMVLVAMTLAVSTPIMDWDDRIKSDVLHDVQREEYLNYYLGCLAIGNQDVDTFTHRFHVSPVLNIGVEQGEELGSGSFRRPPRWTRKPRQKQRRGSGPTLDRQE